MALQITTYTDPGVYIGEVIVPGAVNIATTPVQIGIVGPGDRVKRVTNEVVQRGLVEDETLTLINETGAIAAISAPVGGVQTLTGVAFVAGDIGKTITVSGATSALNNGTFTILDVTAATTVTYANPTGVVQGAPAGTYAVIPYALLANRSDRALQNTTVFRNSVALNDNFLAYPSAFVQGDVATDRNFTAPNNTFVLSMDGNIPITIRFVATAAATSIVVVGGTQFDVTLATATQPALTPITITEIAAGINAVLQDAAADALGYGAAYASAARSVTAGLRITSPLTTPASDVQVLEPIANDLNAAAASRFFSTWVAANGVKAASYITVSRLVYLTTAVYTANYINVASNTDDLNNTGVQELIKVGSYAGVGNFESAVDYVLTSDTIDWGGAGLAPDTAPLYPPLGQAGTVETYDVSANDNLSLSFDGRAAVTIDLNALASPPLGYANPAVPAAATAAEVAANINAVISNSSTYGPLYKEVAQVVTLGAGNFVQLTSPTEGESGAVQILVPAALSANIVVFGLSATQTVSVTGTGTRPTLAALYYVTYSITRPTADYNVQKRFFTLDSAKADLGPTSADNPLVMACEVAFINNAPSVVVVQVDDTSSPGTPTRAEYLTALNATTNTDVITDVVLLTTDLASQTDLKDHVEFQSSPTEKHYRRGWFGMARSTDVGDKDTADTFVYRARRTLQVAADSPGRGRMILVAPPQLTGVSRDITLEDGSTQTVNLDSTYLAVALAAKKSSFTSPATSLAKKSISGFNISDITSPWLKAERGLMAGQGTMVVTYDAGVFKILDPVTTEKGGGGLAAFSYESTSSQKDNVSRKVDQALDANIVGIVPTDLADFIIDIKLIIAAVITGEIGSFAIGPFRNPDNTARAIDLTTDVEVQQDPNDPTKYFFKYWFNLRYPALRLFGEFSVDNPFFAPASA
ncbi:hypothetical protein Rctr197k_065 [Virus Rctr197k]|nr:hypothetical protein Rctr197k_065 [Virus Rctr197k]